MIFLVQCIHVQTYNHSITQKTTLAFVQIDLECFYTRDYNHEYNVYNHFNYVALLLQDEKDHAITITFLEKYL